MGKSRGNFDLNTWLWWIALTAVGNVTAVIIISLVGGLLGAALAGASGNDGSTTFAQLAAIAPVFALAGAVLGASQWLMLRRYIQRAGWWIGATAAGWMAGYLWSLLLFPPGSDTSPNLALWLLFLFIGLASGSCQWLLMRLQFERASIWIAVAIGSMAIASAGLMLGGIRGLAIFWLPAAALNGWVLLRLPRKESMKAEG